jgi:orotate phosphoribosyltransferase
MRNAKEWMEVYRLKKAFWLHDGNPKRPHARLTSGQHSDGFFNSRLVVEDKSLLKEAVSDLGTFLFGWRGTGGAVNLSDVNRVVGPATGATDLAKEIANYIGTHRGYPCQWASPEKEGEGKERRMVFRDERHKVLPGEFVLLCEDVLSTGKSVNLTMEAVREASGVVLPHVLVLVNRSGLAETSGRGIISLIRRRIPMWNEKQCPLCQKGSEAIPPKGENWERFTREY